MVLSRLKTYKLKFWQQWLLHSLLIWLILTGYDLLTYWHAIQKNGYYIFYNDGSPYTVWDRFYNQVFLDLIWVGVLVVAFFVEAAYHLAYRKLDKFYRMFGALLIVACIAYFAVLVFDTVRQGGQIERLLISPFYVVLFSTIYGILYATVRNFIYGKIYTAELKTEQVQAELSALKAHINPHFFFNTLNTIYGTALEENATRTADSLEQLSNIMRYTMNEAQQDYTAVASELRFIEDYLHLQSLRLPERANIAIKSELNYDGKAATIAPMLLMPFIENAYKYGISIDHNCWVQLELTIQDQQLHLFVSNRVIKQNNLTQSLGTGIEHTKKRLQLLYPHKHQLKISQEAKFTVDLKIDLI